MALIFRTNTTEPSEVQPQQPTARQSRLPAPKPAIPKMRPDNPEMYDLSTPLDLVQELSFRRADERVTDKDLQQFTLVNVPAYLKMGINQVCANIAPRPQLGAVISTCVLHGIQHFADDNNLAMLGLLKTRALTDKSISSEDRYDLLWFFEHFPMSTGDSAMAGTHRMNVLLTKEAHMALRDRAGSLGFSFSVLASLCCMHTLSSQECVDHEYSGAMAQAVARFLRRAGKRRRMAEILIEAAE